VGRIANAAAYILQGKHKPLYTRSRDVGDHVVIVNAENVEFKGKNKWKNKVYRHHTGYPGGLKEFPATLIRDTKPEKILERAIKGMLPKNKLRRKQMARLKVYAGNLHPHDRQLMQIKEDDYHQDDNSSHMNVTVIDTFWDNFPDSHELVYRNNEPTPENNKIHQHDYEDAEEIITAKSED